MTKTLIPSCPDRTASLRHRSLFVLALAIVALIQTTPVIYAQSYGLTTVVAAGSPVGNDLIWQNAKTGMATAGVVQPTLNLTNSYDIGAKAGWNVVGVANMNPPDNVPDLVWQNQSTREVWVWYLGGTNGFTPTGYASISGPQPGWTAIGLADVNHDGYNDLIWQNDSDGTVYVWYLQGVTYLGAGSPGAPPSGWRAVGMAHFSNHLANGCLDILWQNRSSQQAVIWVMTGTACLTFLRSDAIGTPTGWNLVAAADFNADTYVDLLWQNNVSSQLYVWYLGGTDGVVLQSAATFYDSIPPASNYLIPNAWVAASGTLMFTSDTITYSPPSWFSVIIENSGTYSANGHVVAANACYIQYLAQYTPSNILSLGDDAGDGNW